MAPLALVGLKEVFAVPLRSIKLDTLPKVFIISKQVVSYQTHGGTCYLGGSTPKKSFLADSSKTNHKL
jgi:hypothetical protein